MRLRTPALALLFAALLLFACHKADLVETTPLPPSAAYRTLRLDVTRTDAFDDGDRDVLGKSLASHLTEKKPHFKLVGAGAPADLVLKVQIQTLEQSGILASGPATVTVHVDIADAQGKIVGQLDVSASGKGSRTAVGTGNVMVTVDKERDTHPALRDIARSLAEYMEKRAR
jgi:hypothetical protein